MDLSSPEDYVGPKTPADANAIARAKADANTPAGTAIAPVPTEPVPQAGPIQITVADAILLTLKNNISLSVQEVNPEISRTVEQEDLSQFDPDLKARVQHNQNKIDTNPQTIAALGLTPGTTRVNSGQVELDEFLPTGTMLSLLGTTNQEDIGEDFYTTRAGLSVTQSLLRGFGTAVNLATVNQARIDTTISQYELRGFTQSLVAQAEETYWNYVLALRQIDIVTQSLELAQQQMHDTQERIRVGVLAQTELAAAEAQVALRKEDLINAKSTLATTKLSLLRLTSPQGRNLFDRVVIARSLPVEPKFDLGPVEPHIALALQMRPEINQAKLLIDRDELELVKTKNGLLPQLNFFTTLGKTGYADSFSSSIRRISSEDNYDALMGLELEYPPLNRSARAANLSATLKRNQDKSALANLEQLVETDVRGAYIEITRSHEQVAATAATSALQAESLRAETEKFKVGRSTSLLVAQAQTNLLSAQIAEIQAMVNYINAVVEFYRLEGTLLQRRGVASPGEKPVGLKNF